MTTSLSGRPYLDATRTARSSPTARASSAHGPGGGFSVGTPVTDRTTAIPSPTTRPNTMLRPSRRGTGPGPVVIRNWAARYPGLNLVSSPSSPSATARESVPGLECRASNAGPERRSGFGGGGGRGLEFAHAFGPLFARRDVLARQHTVEQGAVQVSSGGQGQELGHRARRAAAKEAWRGTRGSEENCAHAAGTRSTLLPLSLSLAPSLIVPSGAGSAHSADASPSARSCLYPSGHSATSRSTMAVNSSSSRGGEVAEAAGRGAAIRSAGMAASAARRRTAAPPCHGWRGGGAPPGGAAAARAGAGRVAARIARCAGDTRAFSRSLANPCADPARPPAHRGGCDERVGGRPERPTAARARAGDAPEATFEAPPPPPLPRSAARRRRWRPSRSPWRPPPLPPPPAWSAFPAPRRSRLRPRAGAGRCWRATGATASARATMASSSCARCGPRSGAASAVRARARSSPCTGSRLVGTIL